MPEVWYNRNLQAVITQHSSSVPPVLYACLMAVAALAACALLAATAFRALKVDPRAVGASAGGAAASATHVTDIPLLQPQRSVDCTMMWHA
jgi:hypothetical protein